VRCWLGVRKCASGSRCDVGGSVCLASLARRIVGGFAGKVERSLDAVEVRHDIAPVNFPEAQTYALSHAPLA
jgi:hypothetical protein